MLNRKFINVQVICPRDINHMEKIKITLVLESGEWIPLPCNGCENLDGSQSCRNCRAALTLMFYRNPELDTSRPVRPSFPDSEK